MEEIKEVFRREVWGKKKKAAIVLLLLIVAIVSGIKGYQLWQQRALFQETVAKIDWEIPLDQEFTYKDWSLMKQNEDFEKHGLKIFSVDAKENDSGIENLFGVMNEAGEILIPAVYWYFTPNWERGYLLGENWDTERAHYYTLDGKDFIEKTFESASGFEGGYAVVKDEAGYHIIQPDGDRTLSFECDYLELFDEEKGLYQFEKVSGNDITGGSWGIVNSNGSVILEPKYDIIEKADEDKILVVYTTGKQYQESRYLDSNFQPLFSERFEEAGVFCDGLAPVKRKNGIRGLINTKGEMIQELEYDTFYFYEEGMAVVGRDGNLCGIDQSGKIVFEVPYQESGNTAELHRGFREGLLVFQGKNGKFGYLGQNGEIVIPPVFDEANPFKNGRAYVEAEGKGGVIKRYGV